MEVGHWLQIQCIPATGVGAVLSLLLSDALSDASSGQRKDQNLWSTVCHSIRFPKLMVQYLLLYGMQYLDKISSCDRADSHAFHEQIEVRKKPRWQSWDMVTHLSDTKRNKTGEDLFQLLCRQGSYDHICVKNKKTDKVYGRTTIWRMWWIGWLTIQRVRIGEWTLTSEALHKQLYYKDLSMDHMLTSETNNSWSS